MQLTTRPYHLKNPEGIYFVTFTVVYWLGVFVRARFKEVLVQSLNYCITHKGLRVHVGCLMSSHAYLIISVQQPEKVGVSDIIKDLKKVYRFANYQGGKSRSGKPAGMVTKKVAVCRG